MEYNDLINELLQLLDKNDNIILIKKIKYNLLKDQNLLENINKYHINHSIELKKKLYQNENYVKYLKLENEIILLTTSIKTKFKKIKDQENCCENC